MHWTVVGGAASVGKGRPGSVSTQRKRESGGGPIWTQAVRNRPNPNVAKEPGRKKEMHTTTNTTTQQSV